VATKAIGGGTSAVAAWSHAACARFRGTDPLITSYTPPRARKAVGVKDEFGRNPEGRWMWATTFEPIQLDLPRREPGHGSAWCDADRRRPSPGSTGSTKARSAR
jgi:hypothetical protein